MAKQFVRVRDADERALAFYVTLRKIEKLPLVEVHILEGKRPVLIRDKTNAVAWDHFSIDGVIALDPDEAGANGGSYSDLILSGRTKARPRLPQAEVDRGVLDFLAGHEDER